MSEMPLGEPGLGRDGFPNKSFDQAPHTRRAFSYQDYAAYALILKSLSQGLYQELWLEHHDDILAVRADGSYDIYQVKTRDFADKFWEISDKPIQDILTRFCRLQAKYGNAISTFYVYSNVKPYIPANNASINKKAKSIVVLAHEIISNEEAHLIGDYTLAYNMLLESTGSTTDTLTNVLGKLHFVTGPGVDSFRSDLATNLCSAVPKLESWSIASVRDLQLELIRIVESAATANVSPLLLHTSHIEASGLPGSEIRCRRVQVETIRKRISNSIRKQKLKNGFALMGVVSTILLLGGFLLRPVFQESPLQRAMTTIQAASRGVLPAEFKESVAIVRMARKPLNKLNLTSANIECQDLSSINMLRATGQFLHGTGVIFDDSVLVGSDFSNSELNGAKFRHARMDNVFLEKSNMTGANFYGAEVRNAKMSGATLPYSNLSRGDFSNGDFTHVSFNMAEMEGADFSKANMSGATFNDADISGADFTGAKNLTQDMLLSACVSSAKLPHLDKPLFPPKKRCYQNAKEQEERRIKRFAVLFVSQVAVSHGYCRDTELQFRLPNSKLHPETNDIVFVPPSELDDVPLR